MRNVFVFISIVAMATLFSSCATIVAGGDPSITISSSSVTEPVTITTEKQTYPNVTLPAVVQVKRKKLDGQRIRIEAENYKFQDIVLRKEEEYNIEPTFKKKENQESTKENESK